MYGGQIPDSSFSATSAYTSDYLPKYGRLNGPHLGWCAKTKNNMPNEYLQIDLGVVYWVCGVATHGRRKAGEWTTKYKISLSMNNITWNIYQWHGSDKVGPALITLRVDAATLTKVSSNVFISFYFYFFKFLFLCAKTVNIFVNHIYDARVVCVTN